MKTRFLKPALLELREAVAAYNEIRPGLGDELRDEVDAALDRIEFWPHAWSRASKRARMCRTKRFKYIVVYVPLEHEIIIVAIMHASRRPGYWKRRLGGIEG
jgi:hypothetical protein